MTRFILLSLLFLGALFYELSGGSNFDPDATRLAAVEARQERDIARRAALDTADVQPVASPQEVVQKRPEPPAPTVEPVALALRSFDEVTTPDRRRPVIETPAQPTAAEANAPDEPELSLSAFVAQSAPRNSIIFSGSSNVASSDDVQTQTDFRVIKGSLVNIRSGPGTDYDVVDQLSQNTPVEVLTDSGNGWVQLRTLEGGSTGWVAEFLLATN